MSTLKTIARRVAGAPCVPMQGVLARCVPLLSLIQTSPPDFLYTSGKPGRYKNFVRGVTTAATVWFGAVLGLAFGSGLLLVGALGTVVALVILVILPAFEKGVASDWYATLTVSGAIDALSEDDLRGRVEGSGIAVRRMKLSYDLARKEKTLVCDLKLTRREAFELSKKVAQELARAPGVTRLE